MAEPAPSARGGASGLPPGSAAGESTIHDLGYRRYEGAREPAGVARRAVFVHGVRAMFGLGRPFKAKVVPAFVAAFTTLPALAMVTASNASQGQVPVVYVPLLQGQLLLFVLFTAAQAPEVLSRDQQHRVLPLLLTRNVTRTGYAVARWLAVTVALLALALVPSLVLYVGEVAGGADPAAAFTRMGWKAGPILVHATCVAVTVGGVGAALAAWTPRRAYASAAILGVFLVAAAVGGALESLGGLQPGFTDRLDTIRALATQARLLFDEPTRQMETQPPPPVWSYLAQCAVVALGSLALLVARVRRVVA